MKKSPLAGSNEEMIRGMTPVFAMLSLVAAMSMTGANVPLGKAIAAEIPVAAFLVIRFVVSSVLLAVLVRLEPGPALTTLSRRQWFAVLALGLVGSLLFTLFLLEGVKRTAAADAGIITATLPAVIAVLGIVKGERFATGSLAMIALAVAGVALIQVGGAEVGGATLIGNLLVGLAVLCEAVFVLVSRPTSRVLRPLRLSLAVSLASLACCLPFAATALAQVDWSRISPATWALAAWYICTSSILATVLWYGGVAHVPAWQAGLATAAVPVAALVVSALYLGEAISPVQVTGAALVIAAIAIGSRPGSADKTYERE